MFDWIGEFVKELFNLIPKLVYLLYTSLISLVDLFQLLFRKLAGLDVYYVDGEPIGGDLVTNFIQGILGIRVGYGGSDYVDNIDYSALSTVFWAFVIFGLVICFVSTLIAIIKSHYSYNEKSAKGPMPIVATAGKAVINMVAVPIIIVLGLWLSQAILTALDSITSTTSSSVVSMFGETTVKDGEETITISRAEQYLKPVQYVQNDKTYETYLYYDIFGYTANIWYFDAIKGVLEAGEDILEWISAYESPPEDLARIAARTQTFSGSMFQVAAYNANRIRRGGSYTTSDERVNAAVTGFGGGGLNLFAGYTEHTDDPVEYAATMVDTAFANFLHLDKEYELSYDAGLAEERYFKNFTTKTLSTFSKFNVGLVWYYYDLWSFNFIVGFGSIIVCIVIFINVILGLMTRFFMCLVLFFVMPPLAGLMPLDGGKAFGTWRDAFIKQALMAYGAVVGMNLILLLLPFINQIDFFNIKIADLIVQTLFIIVGLITIKTAISVLSGIIGADDANKAGDTINKEVGGVASKAFAMTAGAAGVATKAFMKATPLGWGTQLAGAGIKKVGGALGSGVKTLAGKVGDTALGRGAKSLGALLKQGTTAFNTQRELNKAEKDLKESGSVLSAKQQDDFIKGLDGRKKVSDDQILTEAMNNGFSKSQAKRLVKSLVRSDDDKIMASATAAHYGEKDKNFARFHYSGHKDDDFTKARALHENATKRHDAAADLRAYQMKNPTTYGRAVNQAWNTVVKGIGASTADISKQFMANFKTGITQSDGINEFITGATKGLKDMAGIKDKPSDAEQTAKNTAALGEKFDKLDKTLLELTNELRQDRNKKP